MKKGLALSITLVFMIMAGILVVHVPWLEANTIYVPDNYPTINQAIFNAADGDVVVVRSGTYFENVYFWGDKSITVQSTNPDNPMIVASTIINGSNIGSTVTFYGYSILNGFTVQNGNAGVDNGGGISCWSCSPEIKNCIIVNNKAANGGGIYCYDSSAKITNCTISYNTATAGDGGGICCSYNTSPVIITGCIVERNEASAGNGGGIYCSQALATIENCTITNNGAIPSLDDPSNPFDSGISTGNGGGIYSDKSSLIIRNCTVNNNSSTASSDTINRGNSGRGGGIYFFDLPSEDTVVEDTTINNNSAENSNGTLISYGGGIYCAASSFAPHFINCTINNNSATNGGGIACMTNARLKATASAIEHNHALNSGGGIYCSTAGIITIDKCTIKDNEAISGQGGGIYRQKSSSPMTLSNCVLAVNLARLGEGGGIYNYNNSAPLELIHCTMSGNVASSTTGGAIYNYLSNAVVKNSIIWLNLPDEISGDGLDVTYSDVRGGYGDPEDHNINIDPKFVDPDSGDYRLSASSPCIDLARWLDPPVAEDKDSQPRPMDGNHDGSWASDMGAYEAEGPNVIKLDQFTATPGGGQIILSWTTLSEIDTAGFNLWRSNKESGEYTKINAAIIPSEGGATLKAEYSYVDTTAAPGITYFYRLEDIDTHGVSNFHGPVSAAIPAPISIYYSPIIPSFYPAGLMAGVAGRLYSNFMWPWLLYPSWVWPY